MSTWSASHAAVSSPSALIVSGLGSRVTAVLRIRHRAPTGVVPDDKLAHPACAGDDLVVLAGVSVVGEEGHERLGAHVNAAVNPAARDVYAPAGCQLGRRGAAVEAVHQQHTVPGKAVVQLRAFGLSV